MEPMHSDRLSVDDAALPDLARGLSRAASDTSTRAQGLSPLINWAGADAAFGAAAGSLRRAQRRLDDTGSALSSMHRDLSSRADLLGRTQTAQASAPRSDDDGWTIGDKPSLLDPSWFAFLTKNDSPEKGQGWELGFGWIHAEGLLKEDDIRGKGSTLDWFSALVAAGDLDGGKRYGVRGSAQLAALNWALGKNDFNIDRVEMHVAQVQADASFGSDGASFGGGASLGGAAITAGSPSKSSDSDESVRLGLSASVGAAGRLHWSDEDQDGSREYGFGFDLGPISADVKLEKPWEALNPLATTDVQRSLRGGNLPDFR
jgi:hypothetical protein